MLIPGESCRSLDSLTMAGCLHQLLRNGIVHWGRTGASSLSIIRNPLFLAIVL